MSPSRHSDPTVAYYDERAEEYARETVGVDMEALYEPFRCELAQCLAQWRRPHSKPDPQFLDAQPASGRKRAIQNVSS